MDENRLEFEGNALNRRYRNHEASQDEAYEGTYTYLMNQWMYAFDKDGSLKGFHGGVIIRGVIKHYEKKDTVDGYRRCALMMKLLEEYNQRYPRRHG